MDPIIKEWIDLYTKIAESVSDLVVILDHSFDILYANQKAASVFYIDDLSLTLEQVFDNETVLHLNDEIGSVLYIDQKKSLQNFAVNIKTGYNYEFDLVISPIKIKDEKLILLVFIDKSSKKNETYIDKIQMKLSRHILQENNEVIKSLLSEVEQLIPFTITGLKSLQTIVNNYSFPVWIKDSQARFIVINKTYSEILGVETSFATGKKQEAFLPSHLVSVFTAIDNYIFNTSNQIILEGIGKKVNDPQIIQNIIQFPIVDKANKVYAIVGLINDEKIERNKEIIALDVEKGFIEGFPKAIALLNFDGNFVQANQDFCKFLGKEKEILISKNFIDVFPYLFSENIKSFLGSDLINDEIFIDNEFNPVDYSSSLVTANLIKISSSDESIKSFIIIIDETKKTKIDDNDLQAIIKNRGKMFDILIQNNPEPIFIYDIENLKFLEVNEAAIKFYGFSRDEFLQMDLTDLYAPEDIQTLLNSFGEESSEGKFSKPFRHRKKDGSTAVVEISKTTFLFNDRKAHFNIVRDITSSIEKEKQNQMLRAIFNSSDSLVITTDANGFITYINNSVIEKLGYTNSELIKSSFASLVIDEDRALINTSIFQSQIRDEVRLETNLKIKDGKLLEAEIIASPILDFNNEVESFTVIIKPSISETKIEEPKPEIKEVIKEVVKEVIVEKSPDPAIYKKIPDANFISGVFHEILTPMNVIIGFAQELVSSIEKPNDEQLEAAEIINQNRLKLMNTMNTVIEYSDIIQDKSVIKIEDITITDIVDTLDINIKDITGFNDIQFGYGKISSSLKFKSDKQKFESLIFSLIKVISRLSKDKKVYFSAYPIDNDTFFVGLSDQYGGLSENIVTAFDLIFNEDKDPKEFGLPKLTTYYAKLLLSLLGGKFYKSIVGAIRQEGGFLFPQVLFVKGKNLPNEPVITEQGDSAPVTIPVDVKPEDISSETKEDILDTNITSHPEDSILSQEVSEELQDLEESLDEKIKEETLPPDQEEEFFKPVTPIAEELLYKIEEEQNQIETQPQLDEQQENKNVVEDNTISQIETITEEKAEVKPEVNIPEQKSETETPFVPPLPHLNLANLSCLYIEDQVDSQILFKVQMKGLRDIKFAVSFEDAQPLLLNYQFDFIVMDINLQGEYNGLDALKIIRTMPALNNIPIIAVTAYVLPGDKEKFITAGFDDFISKPIFKEKMIESLEKIFLPKY